MKLFNIKSLFAFVVSCAALCSAACSDDDGIDNRELEYGYVQFKLYKEASYPQTQDAQRLTRADQTDHMVDQLDYLSRACKLRIRLLSGSTTISQTLTLSATSSEAAEFGLRSDKLELMAGDYQIISFILYDITDTPIYSGTVSDNRLSVVAGGLTIHDLTANVAPRGKVRFNLVKDISELTGKWNATPCRRPMSTFRTDTP